MGLSKSTRIKILLAIDIAFFFVELISGYYVHSLALIADSFHMLNDVLSLFVGLWAVGVAGNAKTRQYTYGWQRAETLGALINGVFLVALCFTIAIEALQRFVEPQVVTNPKVILIVGSAGLVSNIVGLFLFHDHSHGPGGHSHGPSDGHSHGHSHGHQHDDIRDAEEGHSHVNLPGSDEAVADQSGGIADVLPQVRTGAWADSTQKAKRISFENAGQGSSSPNRRRKSSVRSRTRASDIPIYPASFRNSIIEAAAVEPADSENNTDNEYEEDAGDSHHGHDHSNQHADENTALLGGAPQHSHSNSGGLHREHKHNQPKAASSGGSHGHSHGDLNMRGVFLHVLGDALGNIGVIGTALFIWKTDYEWRFYSDPAISLIITIIILGSAIPLCKAASRILLQGVPAGIDVADIEDDILKIPDIVSCHHVHVWQLSDTKLIASLHVSVGFQFEGDGSQRYMKIAREIRRCLHGYGIHSSTIQPEFCTDDSHGHKMVSSRHQLDDEETVGNNSEGSSTNGAKQDPHGCMLDCDDDCGDDGKCCDPADEVPNSKKK